MDWHSSLHIAASSGEYLPFWARTGYDGIMPVSSSATALVGGDVRTDISSGIFMGAGANAAFSIIPQNHFGENNAAFILDRLYFTAGWRMLKCEVGIKSREKELGDLSLTGGNIIYSGNARNLPGINCYSDWIYFGKSHKFGIRGNIAHYEMRDLRYVTGTMVHNKSFAFRLAISKDADFIMGLDHWAQWGGTSPTKGTQPATFDDYMRIFLARGGGSGATESDQINVLGNHLGREFLRVNWRADSFAMTFQYDKPFEDGSSTRFQNYPDGVWSLRFRFNDKDAWVNEVLYELVTTAWQSGPIHDRPATEDEMDNQADYLPGRVVIGGKDGYFNNSCYMSGWTHYGRSLGLPLMIVHAPGEDGVTPGFASNRVNGHHIGLRGKLSHKYPYTFKATYSSHRGCYDQAPDAFFASEQEPWQVSLAFELTLPKSALRAPLYYSVGLYADYGKIFPDSVGVTLRMFYKDSRKF